LSGRGSGPGAGSGLARLVQVRPGEAAAVAWSFAYFFALLAGYYVLRPLRDEMGIAGGVRNLPWLFTATFLVMLAAQPVYGALVARFARRHFVPIVYHFFVFNIAVFWVLLSLEVAPARVAQVFFVWISVFNLFAVSVFWSFMADLYASEQSRRLFGLIGAGGTAGSLLGPVVTLALVGPLGPVNLLIVAGLLLEVAVFCVYRLERAAARLGAVSAEAAEDPYAPQGGEGEQKLGGGWLAGITGILLSPYLAGAALWVSLLSFAGTILYLEQANLVAAASHEAAAQTRIFAGIDLAVSIATLVLQAAVSGQFLARFGVAAALGFQPAIFALGFALMAFVPTLIVAATFQVVQRTANFAISNLGRQILFTTVGREAKYKGKNVIDVVVFRGSDALYGWVFAVMRGAGLGLAAVSGIAAPIALGWLGLAIVLGRAQAQRAGTAGDAGADQGSR
jgi:AAA family ATP:ADP antiporter